MNEIDKVFKTAQGEVTFKYPGYWLNEIENGITYLFYEEYLGSFRLTPRILPPEKFNIKEYLEKEFLNKNEFDPSWKTLNGKEFLYYESDWVNKNQIYRIHHYITGNNDTLLTCSFAYNSTLIKDPIGAIEITKEITGVERLLSSLKFKGDVKSKTSEKKTPAKKIPEKKDTSKKTK